MSTFWIDLATLSGSHASVLNEDMRAKAKAKRFYTVGHSTYTLEEFITLLKTNGIRNLVDVRRWPTSRISPWFKKDHLEHALRELGISYHWLGESLGGYRPHGLGEASPNKSWRNESFRNYADYAMTDNFAKGLKELISLAEDETTAVMCAEKMYTSCHRRIISDYLVAQGHEVIHIVDLGRLEPHKLNLRAVIKEGLVTYPGS